MIGMQGNLILACGLSLVIVTAGSVDSTLAKTERDMKQKTTVDRICKNFRLVKYVNNPGVCELHPRFTQDKNGVNYKTTTEGIGEMKINCSIDVPKNTKKIGIRLGQSTWSKTGSEWGTNIPLVIKRWVKPDNKIYHNYKKKMNCDRPTGDSYKMPEIIHKVSKGAKKIRFSVLISDSWDTAQVKGKIGTLMVSFKPQCIAD